MCISCSPLVCSSDPFGVGGSLECHQRIRRCIIWVHGARRITNCTRRSVRNGAHGGYNTCVGARRLRARHVTSHGAFHGACLFHACYYFIPGVCVCKLSLWTMRASRNLACLVGRTQASEFLFSTRKLGPKFKMGSPPLCEYTFSSSFSSSSSSSDSAT